MRSFLIFLTVGALACSGGKDLQREDTGNTDDLDGDGITAALDCDDEDASVGLPSTWFEDKDGDGHAGTGPGVESCEQSEGLYAEATDCNDTDSDIHPDADEICDGFDNNCDNSTDGSGSVDAGLWYLDVDGDGYGDADDSTLSCTTPSNYVSNGDDCDVDNAEVYPEAPELCDEIDNDCDGEIDEDLTRLSQETVDSDGDGNAEELYTYTWSGNGDLLVFETFSDLREMKEAVVAAQEVCSLPIVAQMTFTEEGRTLHGDAPEEIVSTLEALQVTVIGANCSVGPEPILRVGSDLSWRPPVPGVSGGVE